jgi:hypothetical protein
MKQMFCPAEFLLRRVLVISVIFFLNACGDQDTVIEASSLSQGRADGTGDSAPATSSATSVELAAPSTKAWSSFFIDLGTHFLPSNICAGKTIFGRLGQAACLSRIDNRFNNEGAPSNKRRFPIGYTDSDGLQSMGWFAIDKVNRDDFINCGSSGSVTDRITDCSSKNGVHAAWDGAEKSNTGHGKWSLVTRIESTELFEADHEIWRDERTQLLWSSRIRDADLIFGSTKTWCQAAGNNDQLAGPCNEVSSQPNQENPLSICGEGSEGGVTRSEALIGENWASGTYHAKKGGLGLHPEAGGIEWYLPNRETYFQAYANGMAYVLPNFGGSYWTSSVYSGFINSAWYFNFDSEGRVTVDVTGRNSSEPDVLCVGR